MRHYQGLDINTGNIAVCRRRLKAAPDAGIAFESALSTATESSEAYDAIFCMAVLRHGSLGLPGVTRCDHLIHFTDFARAVADFERCLKPGGLLIIRHSNFSAARRTGWADFRNSFAAAHRRGDTAVRPRQSPPARL